ncbi:MAG: hypothetical protein ACI92A_001449, partial [Candidatus Paceibacteria bacterium]
NLNSGSVSHAEGLFTGNVEHRDFSFVPVT